MKMILLQQDHRQVLLRVQLFVTSLELHSSTKVSIRRCAALTKLWFRGTNVRTQNCILIQFCTTLIYNARAHQRHVGHVKTNMRPIFTHIDDTQTREQQRMKLLGVRWLSNDAFLPAVDSFRTCARFFAEC